METGFAPEEYVNILLKDRKCDKTDLLFYDIETTGLSPLQDMVYLIGTAAYNGVSWEYTGYFCEEEADEPLILEAFTKLSEKYSIYIQYNGSTFDKPFISKRCEIHRIPYTAPDNETDLFREFSNLKRLLSLPSMKQITLEKFLSISRSFPGGKDGIKLWKAFLADHDPIKEKMLIGHNYEDLSGLVNITVMAAYLQLYHGMIYVPEPAASKRVISDFVQITSGSEQINANSGQINQDTEQISVDTEYYTSVSEHITITPDRIALRFCPVIQFPVDFAYKSDQLYLKVCGENAFAVLPLKDGKMRLYYPDYRNYDYIPSEDTAITRSLSCFLDKSLRKRARPETCYTWFDPSDGFLKDAARQEKYLKQVLPIILRL